MTIRLKAVVIFAFMFFLFMGLAFGQDSNQINCQSVSGEYRCEVIHLQEYQDGTILKIVSEVAAKVDTDIYIGQDTLSVRYVDKTYEVWGYGAASGRTQVLASAKNVTDIRNELVILIGAIRLED